MPITKSKLSTSIQKRIKVSGKTRIDADVMAVFKESKASY